jgi:hypothetical protein
MGYMGLYYFGKISTVTADADSKGLSSLEQEINIAKNAFLCILSRYGDGVTELTTSTPSRPHPLKQLTFNNTYDVISMTFV